MIRVPQVDLKMMLVTMQAPALRLRSLIAQIPHPTRSSFRQTFSDATRSASTPLRTGPALQLLVGITSHLISESIPYKGNRNYGSLSPDWDYAEFRGLHFEYLAIITGISAPGNQLSAFVIASGRERLLCQVFFFVNCFAAHLSKRFLLSCYQQSLIPTMMLCYTYNNVLVVEGRSSPHSPHSSTLPHPHFGSHWQKPSQEQSSSVASIAPLRPKLQRALLPVL